MSITQSIVSLLQEVAEELTTKILELGLKTAEDEELTAEVLSPVILAVFEKTKTALPKEKKAKSKVPAAKDKKPVKKGKKDLAAEEEIDVSALGEFVIILNYGPKSHALFGETAVIKPKLMKYNKDNKPPLFGYNPKLKLDGEDTPGWTIRDKDRLEEAKAFFDELGITYEEKEKPKKEKAGKEPAAKAKTTKAKAGDTAKPKAAAATKPKAPAPAKKAAAAEKAPTLKAKENAWGNSEDMDTGIVFMKLPVGTSNRNLSIAVGMQDAESDEKGLASVVPLTDEQKAECEEKKWKVLSDEMMAMLKTKEKKLYKELAEMLERAPAEAEEEAEGDAEEEAEEEEDEAEEDEAEDEAEEDDTA